ncbi:biopolymer transporter ExbD [Chelativorans sp. AA-79]|uniref:ExbD/TolR family protein n=1 Tax=Chelativorans sp. AA-79 TaxID=3028735 RepID=UPI0023F9E09A|nr:biopolymer transporter ExbD [Chelativorans sp. AA-79]WEX10860.1 biopolymer transporter ExbD [Chelativorans sp. AA-79]
MDRTTILPTPRRRRIAFVLTPLIDVIFLLLIFFMLSSQIAPYSLLPLGGVAAGTDEAEAAPAEAVNGAAQPLVVRIAHGEVTIGAERMAIAQLQDAVGHFRRQGVETYLLIPSGDAELQDVVSTLEAMKAASAGSVTLLNPIRERP